MSNSRRLYASTVKEKEPCQGQYQLFLKYCGDNGYITITDRWCRSHASEFDWEWAKLLLSESARESYDAVAAWTIGGGQRGREQSCQ